MNKYSTLWCCVKTACVGFTSAVIWFVMWACDYNGWLAFSLTPEERFCKITWDGLEGEKKPAKPLLTDDKGWQKAGIISRYCFSWKNTSNSFVLMREKDRMTERDWREGEREREGVWRLVDRHICLFFIRDKKNEKGIGISAGINQLNGEMSRFPSFHDTLFQLARLLPEPLQSLLCISFPPNQLKSLQANPELNLTALTRNRTKALAEI